MRNKSGIELNKPLNWAYKLALALALFGLIDFLYLIYIFVLTEYDLFIIIILLMIGVVLTIISVIITIFTPEVRKMQQFQPALQI